MFYLTNVFQKIVHRLYYGSLSEQNLVGQHTKPLFLCVLFLFCNQPNAFLKERMEQLLRNITLVCKQFPEQLFCKMCHALKDFMLLDSVAVTYVQSYGVYKADACALTFTETHKKCHG